MPKIAAVSFLNDEWILGSVLHLIDTVAERFGMTSAKRLKLGMACEDMILGRIKNAYPRSDETIDVDITVTSEFLEISVRDKGAPYWQGEIQYNPEKVDENAAGLEEFLIANACDSSGSEKLGIEGQRRFVRLNLLSPIAFETKNSTEERAPENLQIDIVETKPEEKDIFAAITCIYDEYRYSYGYERLYYPERFKELIVSGGLRSFLAIGENGETAGHYCLSAAEDFPPEWATVVVRRPFRGRHIFDRMCAHGVEMAKQAGERAIMTQPTAYHTATQKVAQRYGYSATGFLFQYVYAGMESEYNKTGKRLDLAVAVKPLANDWNGFAYLPEEHSDFIRQIYDDLGMKLDFPAPFRQSQPTVMNHTVNNLMKNGRITVTRAGNDFEKELSHATGFLRQNKAEMVELLINMSDSAAAFAYETAKKYGYFFTGIIPCGAKGDHLIMQNLFWARVDFDSVATTGKYTEFLDYIKRKA